MLGRRDAYEFDDIRRLNGASRIRLHKRGICRRVSAQLTKGFAVSLYWPCPERAARLRYLVLSGLGKTVGIRPRPSFHFGLGTCKIYRETSTINDHVQ